MKKFFSIVMLSILFTGCWYHPYGYYGYYPRNGYSIGGRYRQSHDYWHPTDDAVVEAAVKTAMQRHNCNSVRVLNTVICEYTGRQKIIMDVCGIVRGYTVVSCGPRDCQFSASID